MNAAAATRPATPHAAAHASAEASAAGPAPVIRHSATSPSSPRVDLYAGIHKALRHFMTDTLVRVGRIDCSDAADRDAALDQLEALLAFCTDHIAHENDFLHTAIEARQPAGSTRIAGEHLEHREAIAALRDDATALRHAAAVSAPSLALRLYRQLALFVADNFEHMHVEETAHNAVLWQHYGDDELQALHGRLLASIAPAGASRGRPLDAAGPVAGGARRRRRRHEAADAAGGAARRARHGAAAHGRGRLGQARRRCRHRRRRRCLIALGGGALS